MLHDWVSFKFPVQSAPPYWGLGFVHVRVLSWDPPPHDTLHVPQSLQLETSPSTKIWAIWRNNIHTNAGFLFIHFHLRDSFLIIRLLWVISNYLYTIILYRFYFVIPNQFRLNPFWYFKSYILSDEKLQIDMTYPTLINTKNCHLIVLSCIEWWKPKCFLVNDGKFHFAATCFL